MRNSAPASTLRSRVLDLVVERLRLEVRLGIAGAAEAEAVAARANELHQLVAVREAVGRRRNVGWSLGGSPRSASTFSTPAASKRSRISASSARPWPTQVRCAMASMPVSRLIARRQLDGELARRAAGAVGDRDEAGLQVGELLQRREQLARRRRRSWAGRTRRRSTAGRCEVDRRCAWRNAIMGVKKGWRRSRRRGVQRRTTPARMSERWHAAGGYSEQRVRPYLLWRASEEESRWCCEIFQTEVGLMSNFNELIACKNSQACAVVDPAFEVDRLLREAKQRGWTITAVLVTHTHHDHVDGVEEMVQATGATVYVGAGEVESLRRAAPSAKIVGLCGRRDDRSRRAAHRDAADAGAHGRRHLVRRRRQRLHRRHAVRRRLRAHRLSRRRRADVVAQPAAAGGAARGDARLSRSRLRTDADVDDRLGEDDQSLPVVQERSGVRRAAHRQERAAAAEARKTHAQLT